MGAFARLWTNYHCIWVRASCRDGEATMRSHCLGKHPRPVGICLVWCCFTFSTFFASFFSPRIVLRVFRADPNPLIRREERSWIPQTNYLRPPAIEKNFLISPPGSPPIGWEAVKEDPPNATPLAEDLIHALRKLQAIGERPAFEQLLDPLDGSGVGVYVEDCDADTSAMDISEEDWVYGESAPAREKWRQFATSMPPH